MNKFASLLKSYTSKDKPCECLQKSSVLPGNTTKEKLESLFKLRQSSSVSPHFPVASRNQDVLVLCLVIVDTLPHEEIWRHWIEDGERSGCKVKLLIHAKYPSKITSTWVRDHTLSQSSQPDWNSIEVIRALLLLLEEGLADPYAGRFVFGTESCLPIYSAKYIWESLFKEDVSWLNARHHVESKWEASNCFLAVDPNIIPPKAVWKSLPGWIMLTRRHAHEIVCLPYCCGASSVGVDHRTTNARTASAVDLVSAYGPSGTWNEWSGGVYAPEEMYFPTMLALLGYLKDQPSPTGSISNSSSSSSNSNQSRSTVTSSSNNNDSRSSSSHRSSSRYHDEVRRQSVNHAEWKRQGEAHPVTFHTFTPSLIKSLRSSGAMFARKFSPISCTLADWIAVMSELDYVEANDIEVTDHHQQQSCSAQESAFSNSVSRSSDTASDEYYKTKKRKIVDEVELADTVANNQKRNPNSV